MIAQIISIYFLYVGHMNKGKSRHASNVSGARASTHTLVFSKQDLLSRLAPAGGACGRRLWTPGPVTGA